MTFRRKRITLMGLGIAGGAVEDALFFLQKGAKLTITDLKTRSELQPSLKRLRGKLGKINFRLGGHFVEDFIDADLIIKNPAVADESPYLQVARDHSVPIETSAGLFSDLADLEYVIGITGTKGKSTTAVLVHRILKTRYRSAYLAGNIGKSLLACLSKNKRGAWGVVELSSWQLEGMAEHGKSPHIALVTNVEADHLNRYKSLDAYQAAKKLIFKNQHRDDVVILNYDDPYLRKAYTEAPSRVVFYSAQEKPRVSGAKIGAYIERGTIHAKGLEKEYASIKTKAILHPANVIAALTVAHVMGLSSKKALSAIASFKGLPGRIEYVATLKGARVYNDTTATNPYATVHSLRAFAGKKIALIAGGEDKNLTYKNLAVVLKSVDTVVLIPGTASDKLQKEAKKLGIVHLKCAKTLRGALSEALRGDPDILLFSPAAASFNMFKNEFDRGDKFVSAVKKMSKKRTKRKK